jgi:hypothetical protein
MVFIQTGGVLAGSAGYFLKWADIGWILAGYLNYWRPNLPLFVIRQLSKSIVIKSKYHKGLGAVKRWNTQQMAQSQVN